jgi:hypothetical protein
MKIIRKWRWYGDTRVYRTFLWLPRSEYREKGVKETRWLQWAWVEDVYWGGWCFNRFADWVC